MGLSIFYISSSQKLGKWIENTEKSGILLLSLHLPFSRLLSRCLTRAMDVSRRYYEEIDDFVRAIGRNSHRRRHLPFWNLALGALASTEASALQSAVSANSSSSIGSSLNLAAGGTTQSAIGDVGEPVGAFSRALTQSSGRVLYVTFHTSPTSHVAPMTSGGPFVTNDSEDVLVASAILSNFLIVIFCADDTLDALVASWVYLEIIHAQRGKSQMATTTSSSSHQTSKLGNFHMGDKNAPRFLTSLPSSFKPLRYASRVSLYGSMAHVRALLDLANNAASDPKFANLSSENPPSLVLLGGSTSPNGTSRRMIPSDYRMSRDDSGMRVLGGGRQYRQSTRPQASEFAFGPHFFKRRTRNAYRMFFIATERLEAIDKQNAEAATRALLIGGSGGAHSGSIGDKDDSSAEESTSSHNVAASSSTRSKKVSSHSSGGSSADSTKSSSTIVPNVHDTSKLILDAAKCLRLASSSDWDELKAILRSENPSDEGDAEGEEDDNDFGTFETNKQRRRRRRR